MKNKSKSKPRPWEQIIDSMFKRTPISSNKSEQPDNFILGMTNQHAQVPE